MEGEVAGKPRPAWLADEGRLASVGRLVRAYDDAVSGLVVPEGVLAGRPIAGADVPPAPPYPKELIGHADFTPDNIVFRGGEAHALIDFDIAKPATRVDEVYNAMLYWAPLMDPVDRDEPLRDVDAPRRARILADAYGMTEVDRTRLLEAAVLWTRRSWHGMKWAAETRGGGWARMWAEGVGDEIKRREAWLERNGTMVEAALLA
jgi:Ser/Thr protein kinase RdoA (MazF antagonist)